MNTLGNLTVATFCENCGFTRALVGDYGDRCTDCGRFVSEEPDVCCAKHEVRKSPYQSGRCPRCEQEERIRAQEQEMMARKANPRMHTTVDSPRW